jgi:signal transduction histidine kinase
MFASDPEVLRLFQTAVGGEASTVTVHLDPTDRDVEFYGQPMRGDDGQVDHIICVAADVTERRQAERAVLESEAKSKFLANMSHELRNPLNSVLGFTQLLGSNEFGELSERQRRYVQHIATSGTQLLTLVNDLLDISMAAAGQMRLSLERADVRPIMVAAADQMAPQAESRGIAVRISGTSPRAALVDRQRLHQALINVISNAIKFTPHGGAVEVSSRAREGRLVITVKDNGIGIPADKLEYVFDEFAQVEATSRPPDERGTGLGLPLSRRLVELMGGALTVRSVLGAGSVFTVAVPLADSGRTTIP